jgi:hypothetical protein
MTIPKPFVDSPSCRNPIVIRKSATYDAHDGDDDELQKFSRAVFKEDGPLVETRRVLSLLYSLNAEGSLLGKVHPFRERL